ncbi:hypothetical protein V8E54_013152 [Elaphomyces granulatus]
MDTQGKQCSGCKRIKPISDFYKKQPPDLTANALQTCAKCRSLRSKSSKKRSSQDIEPATPPPAKKLRELAPASSQISAESAIAARKE